MSLNPIIKKRFDLVDSSMSVFFLIVQVYVKLQTRASVIRQLQFQLLTCRWVIVFFLQNKRLA